MWNGKQRRCAVILSTNSTLIHPNVFRRCKSTDGTIQKLKQHYNQNGGPALEVTLAEVQEDLRLHPPQVINWEEVELTNGTANGHMEQSPGSGWAD